MAEPELNSTRRGPVNTIEQAFSLLRKVPAGTALAYYTGTIPFVTGLLYFLHVMSRNAFASDYCLPASFGLALLYAWMRFWQSVACTRAYWFLGQAAPEKITFFPAVKMMLVQTVFHTFSIIVLLIASTILVPFANLFAMYQISFVHENAGRIEMWARLKSAYRAAASDTFANHMIISVLWLFVVFVFLNAAMSIYLVPMLLKAFLGIESGFSMGGFSLMNTTFLLSAASITYLVTDPLFKAVYVIRQHDVTSAKSGDDLISVFSRLAGISVKALPLLAGLVILASLLWTPLNAHALEKRADLPVFHASDRIETENLEKAIQTVLEQPEYAWKLHKKKEVGEKSGFFYDMAQWMAKWLKKGVDWTTDKIVRFYQWLKNLFAKDKKTTSQAEPSEKLLTPDLLLGCLILLLLALLGAIAIHFKKRKKPEDKNEEKAISQEVDIHDESLTADQLPGEQWLKLAVEFLEKGQIRLAIRAIYLCTLARLSDRGYLQIALHKSNRDYKEELFRKSVEIRPMADDFSGLVLMVDQVWYGMYPADREMYDRFFAAHERIVHYEAG